MDFNCPRSILKNTLILGSEPDYHIVYDLGGLVLGYLAIINVESYSQLFPIHNLVGHASVVGIQLKSPLGETLHLHELFVV